MKMRIGVLAVGLAVAGSGGAGLAQAAVASDAARMEPLQLIQTLVAREEDAGKHRGYYTYLSVEKSERTGGHEWKERVAETTYGKLRYLIEEDGRPLSGDRLTAERARIEGEAADPEAFKRAESARADDEQHARQMLTLLPKAFLFEAPKPDGDTVRVGFRPNPDYSPNGMEERVLHGMSGTVVIEARSIRLRELDGRMPQDVSIGFGLLATIHAGSNFSTKREHLEGVDWKTEALHTDINGKALFLKSIARQQESKHSEFKLIRTGMSVADAVKMLEEQQ